MKTGLSLADLHKLKFYEIELILEGQFEDYKNRWEQTRNIMYIIALANSTKKMKPTDILKFPWDKREIIDWNEHYRAQQEMLDYIKNNGNKKGKVVTAQDLQ